MFAWFQNLFAPPRHMILLVLALWAGLSLAEKRAARRGVTTEQLSSLVLYGMVAYILGGRTAFVLENLSIFSRSPLDVFSLSPNIFEPWAAAVSALLVGEIHRYRQKLPLWQILDALTPVLASLMSGLALSHLAAETAYGRPTDLRWAIQMRNAARHPSQLYELAAALLTFGLIWFERTNARPGILFLTFAALTCAARLFLEAFRGDSIFVLDGLRGAQIIAWGALALCFILYDYIELRPIEK